MLRKPYLVNDVQAQDTLLDRRRVYRTLMASARTAGGVWGLRSRVGIPWMIHDGSGFGPCTWMLQCPDVCCLCAWPMCVCACVCSVCCVCVQDSGIPVPQHIIVDRSQLPAGQTDPGGREGEGVLLCQPIIHPSSSQPQAMV